MAKSIYSIINDSALEIRIKETAEKLEADFYSFKNSEDFIDKVPANIPKIVVLDLMLDEKEIEEIMSHINNNKRLKYVSLIGLVSDTLKTNQISKFLSTRCNLVLTKSKFQRDIEKFLKRNL